MDPGLIHKYMAWARDKRTSLFRRGVSDEEESLMTFSSEMDSGYRTWSQSYKTFFFVKEQIS
jgi:hypothetical protein